MFLSGEQYIDKCGATSASSSGVTYVDFGVNHPNDRFHANNGLSSSGSDMFFLLLLFFAL